MSPAYPHLLINHLPVVMAFVATALLVIAAVRRTIEGAVYGYLALVVVAVLAIPTFVTGNFAPPAIQHMAGVTTDAITLHQVLGLAAMIGSVLVALMAAIPLVLTNIAAKRGLLIAFLVASIVLDGIYTATAFTGGTIGHPELR